MPPECAGVRLLQGFGACLCLNRRWIETEGPGGEPVIRVQERESPRAQLGSATPGYFPAIDIGLEHSWFRTESSQSTGSSGGRSAVQSAAPAEECPRGPPPMQEPQPEINSSDKKNQT